MIFEETIFGEAYIIDLERMEDERGFFGRSFCQKEFAVHGLRFEVAQCNISFNKRKGTLRGMHFQKAPKAESKLVRCIKGAIHDVIIDLRPDSPTYCHWIAKELTSDNFSALYIPDGFAHGFQTLSDNCEVFYIMFEFYAPEYATGVRWDDPAFGIQWPFPNPILSERDRAYPLFEKFPR